MQDASDDSPRRIVQTLSSYQASGALRAAIELDVFTRIAAGRKTAADLADDAQTDARGMRILCDALAVMGYLEHQEQSYALTPTAQIFLDRKSLFYLGSLATVLTHDYLWRAFHDVASAVRRGGAVMDRNGLTPDHPFWVDFAAATAPTASLTAQPMAEVLGAGVDGHQGWKVLDLACGSGYYGFAIAQRDRSAQITSVDWPTVLQRTHEFARQAGVSDRVRFLPGNLFEVDFGREYDLALLANIYHHFDRESCLRLSRKVHDALKAGGRVAILEFLPDDDRTGPYEAVMFSLTMLVWTPAGEAYTLADYQPILEKAGFQDIVVHRLERIPHRLIVATRGAN